LILTQQITQLSKVDLIWQFVLRLIMGKHRCQGAQIWPVCNKGITQFYLPPTHEPYLPLLPSRKASPPFGWYSLRLPTKGWPGWTDLGGWSHTEI